MVILVEGPDGSGKTTLCNELVKKGYEYIHLSKDGAYKDTNTFYYAFRSLLESKKGQNIVIDRSYISNYVYSTVFEDSDIISPVNLYGMQNLVHIVVMCIPDRKKYLERFEKLKSERQELYQTMDKVYDTFMKVPYKYFSERQKIVIYNMDRVPENEVENFVNTEIL